jgi:signal transduction histidine kinase
MKSIFVRNFLVMAGIVLLSLTIFSIAFASLSYNMVLSDKKDTLEATASIVSITASAKTTESDLSDWDLRMTISTIAKTSGTHITISDQDGVVLSCSDEDMLFPRLGWILPADVLSTVDRIGSYHGVTDLSGYFSVAKYTTGIAVPSPYSSDVTIGYVFVSAGSREMVDLWRAFASIFFVVALAVLLLALIASLILTGRQVAPLREMAEVSRDFAKGNFETRIKIKRRDEMGELIDSYNLMADSIEKSELQRREFIANVSHELKTPMTTISGFADGLLDGTIPPERQEQYLRIIAGETKRLSRLVSRMLDISRMQSIDPKNLAASGFDLTEIARRTILALETRILDKGLDFEVLIPEEAVQVRGEPDAITQVLYNILDNAVKFASSGSVLKLSIWKSGEKAFVSVKNAGETIPEEDLPYIFERFHKSDRSRSMDREGIGLGLYIVKTILSSYGEDIYVKSRDGQTEFVFSLTLKDNKTLKSGKETKDSRES